MLQWVGKQIARYLSAPMLSIPAEVQIQDYALAAKAAG